MTGSTNCILDDTQEKLIEIENKTIYSIKYSFKC